jgi:hypothetical protein
MQKLKLKISEENEIGFKINIKSSESEMSTPNIRFVITETKTGRGWTFKAKKDKDNALVTIPSMKGVVQENQQYNGKLEVILGARYFAPTEVDVNFVEPLKVEASIVNTVSRKKNPVLKETHKNSKIKPAEEVYDFSVESDEEEFLIESTIINKVAKKEEKVEKKISFNDLSLEKKEEAKEIFLKECKRLNIEEPQKHIKEGTEYTKKRLRALMAKAVKEAASKN